MPKPNFLSLTIEKLDEKGRGLAFYQDKVWSFPFTIPGEKVRVSFDKLQKKQKGLQVGEDFEISQGSTDRIIPPCVYFTRCGGCQLQHINYESQLREKQRWLQDLLSPIVVADKIRPILASPRALQYRRRIQLHLGPRGELGYYSPYSQKVVDIDHCLLADEAINREIASLKSEAAKLLQGPKRVAQLGFELTLQEDGRVEVQNSNEARGFLQVNPEANVLMLNLLKTLFAAEQPQRVLELFAGEGNLSFALAREGQSWSAVEANPVSVQNALSDPRQAQLRLKWIQSAAGAAVKRLLSKNESFDFILLDPPREGLGSLLPDLLALKAKAFLYISCWPQHLRADLKAALQAGYQLQWLQAIDFFPQTMHVETLAYCRLG